MAQWECSCLIGTKPQVHSQSIKKKFLLHSLQETPIESVVHTSNKGTGIRVCIFVIISTLLFLPFPLYGKLLKLQFHSLTVYTEIGSDLQVPEGNQRQWQQPILF